MREFTLRNTPCANPISYDETKCVGCDRCLEACQMDVFLPAAVKGEHPRVAYPDECWYCGCCVMECPTGAIRLTHPLMNRTRWVTKQSLIDGAEK